MVTVESRRGRSQPLIDLARRPRHWLRLSLVVAVAYFLVTPFVANVGDAADRLRGIDHRFTLTAIVLQIAALLCYSVMTRAALGDESDEVGLGPLFGMQLITRAVGSTVPGGAAAGPALGYRMMTSAGLSGDHASASLASASVVSAAILNLMLWGALVVSIPLFGFNVVYAIAALVGVVVMSMVAAVLVAIVDRSPLVDRAVRFVAMRIGVDGAGVINSLRAFGEQLQTLIADRPLMIRLSFWAALNWLLDAASLWICLYAFGVTMNPVGLLVAFGVANILAALPISPGGIGVVEWAYIPILVTFGSGFDQATIAVAAYRIGQLLLPMLMGAVAALALSARARRRHATAQVAS